MFDDEEAAAVDPAAAEEEDTEVLAGNAWYAALEARRKREAPDMPLAEFIASRPGVADTTWTGYEHVFEGWAAYLQMWIDGCNKTRADNKSPPLPKHQDPHSFSSSSSSASSSSSSSSSSSGPAWRTTPQFIQGIVRAFLHYPLLSCTSYYYIRSLQPLHALPPLPPPPTGHGVILYAYPL